MNHLTDEIYIKTFLRDCFLLLKLFGDQMNNINRVHRENLLEKQTKNEAKQELFQKFHDLVAGCLTVFLDDYRKMINSFFFNLVCNVTENLENLEKTVFMTEYFEQEKLLKTKRIELLRKTNQGSSQQDMAIVVSEYIEFLKIISFEEIGENRGGVDGVEGLGYAAGGQDGPGFGGRGLEGNGYAITPIREDSLESMTSAGDEVVKGVVLDVLEPGEGVKSARSHRGQVRTVLKVGGEFKGFEEKEKNRVLKSDGRAERLGKTDRKLTATPVAEKRAQKPAIRPDHPELEKHKKSPRAVRDPVNPRQSPTKLSPERPEKDENELPVKQIHQTTQKPRIVTSSQEGGETRKKDGALANYKELIVEEITRRQKVSRAAHSGSDRRIDSSLNSKKKEKKEPSAEHRDQFQRSPDPKMNYSSKLADLSSEKRRKIVFPKETKNETYRAIINQNTPQTVQKPAGDHVSIQTIFVRSSGTKTPPKYLQSNPSRLNAAEASKTPYYSESLQIQTNEKPNGGSLYKVSSDAVNIFRELRPEMEGVQTRSGSRRVTRGTSSQKIDSETSYKSHYINFGYEGALGRFSDHFNRNRSRSDLSSVNGLDRSIELGGRAEEGEEQPKVTGSTAEFKERLKGLQRGVVVVGDGRLPQTSEEGHQNGGSSANDFSLNEFLNFSPSISFMSLTTSLDRTRKCGDYMPRISGGFSLSVVNSWRGFIACRETGLHAYEIDRDGLGVGFKPIKGSLYERITSICYSSKNQCLFYIGVNPHPQVYKMNANIATPKPLLQAQIFDPAFKQIYEPNQKLKLDKTQRYLFTQSSKREIKIFSGLGSTHSQFYSMLQVRKGDKIIDFVPYHAKKVIAVTGDGFICPYTFDTNYSKRLKSPKLVLKQYEVLDKAEICSNEKYLVLASKQVLSGEEEPLEERFFQLYLFLVSEDSSLVFCNYFNYEALGQNNSPLPALQDMKLLYWGHRPFPYVLFCFRGLVGTGHLQCLSVEDTGIFRVNQQQLEFLRGFDDQIGGGDAGEEQAAALEHFFGTFVQFGELVTGYGEGAVPRLILHVLGESGVRAIKIL